MKKNVASQVVGAQMITASDGSAFTGSVTVAVTVDGGTQATGTVGSGACTHEGNGFHTYAPSQAETNGEHVAFTFTGTGAIPVTVQVYTTFPQTGDSFARLGAPAGASVSADIAAVPTAAEINAEVDTALADYDPPTKAELDAAVANVSVDEIQATALADLFNTDSGTTYASAVEGSPVKEIADNAGGSSLTAAAIADAVWDEATTGHTTAGTFGEQVKTDIDAILVDTAEIGAAGAGLTEAGGTGDHLTALATQASVNTIDGNVDAILVDTGTTLPASLATIDGNVDSILVDTGTTLPATLATIDGNVDAILVDTGTTLDGKLDTIDTVVDAVKAKTDSLTFTNTGVVDSNITHVISDPVVSGSSKTTNWGGTE